MNTKSEHRLSILSDLADRLSNRDTPTAFSTILADGLRAAATARTWQEWRESISNVLRLTRSATSYSSAIGNWPDALEEMHAKVHAVGQFMAALEATGTEYEESVLVVETDLL